MRASTVGLLLEEGWVGGSGETVSGLGAWRDWDACGAVELFTRFA